MAEKLENMRRGAGRSCARARLREPYVRAVMRARKKPVPAEKLACSGVAGFFKKLNYKWLQPRCGFAETRQ